MTTLVLGLGISGKNVVHYLVSKGISVIGVDKQIKHLELEIPLFDENDQKIEALLPKVDRIIKSPGIAWDHPIIKKVIGKVEILSEVELAFRALQGQKKMLFGITGSNGKTTTTSLTAHILTGLGKKAVACGNIGLPLLSQVDTDAEILVIELSSYQLETLQTAVLDAAVILNITPNHLERYSCFDEYAKAKLRIERLLKKGGKLFVQEQVQQQFGSHMASFSPFPLLQVEENIATIFPLRYRDGRFSHDFENFQGAFALCQIFATERKFWEIARSFVKPPHRLEFVRHFNGVTYVNDSKATSVDAVIKGVESLRGSVILIAGGVDKGGSYKEWASLFLGKVKKVFLIGKAQDKIYQEVTPFLDAEKVETLQEAVNRASHLAQKGEIVLLSPGCSSFDQFQNFEHRGEIFKQLVFGLEGI